MGFELSRGTANKLKALLKKGGAVGQPRLSTEGTGRFDIHVKITGEQVDGYYPCVTCEYNCSTESWTDFEGVVQCFPANDGDDGVVLEIDKRYRALNYGLIDGELIFVVDYNVPQLGCYLEWTDDDELAVSLDSIKGDGLTIEEEDSDSDSDSDSGFCPKLKVDAGCNLQINPFDKSLEVDVESLAGDGLEVVEDSDSGSDCLQLAVLAGDCILVDADGVAVDTEIASTVTIEVAGEPVLSRDDDSITITTPITTYEYGLNACGLVVSITDLGTVETTSSISDDDDSDSDSDSGDCTIAGTALISTIEGGCTKLGVDLDTATNDVLGPFISDLDFTIDGCTLTVDATRYPLVKSYNADGLLIDLIEGEPEESTVSFSLDECCDEDSDSDGGCGACVSMFGGQLAMNGYTVADIQLGGTIVMTGEIPEPEKLGSTLAMGGSTDDFETHTVYSYNCISGVCVEILGITGAYPTLSACNENCGE